MSADAPLPHPSPVPWYRAASLVLLSLTFASCGDTDSASPSVQSPVPATSPVDSASTPEAAPAAPAVPTPAPAPAPVVPSPVVVSAPEPTTIIRVPVEPADPLAPVGVEVPPGSMTASPAAPVIQPSVAVPPPVEAPPVAVAVPEGDGPVEVKAPRRADASPAALPEGALNRQILKAIKAFPKGGGYAVNRVAASALRSSLTSNDARLVIQPDTAQPSFCSGATYLVFVQALASWHDSARRPLPQPVLDLLMIRGQADGDGIWGRWNANGPGTGRLFKELDLGVNFQSIEHAQPGDFLKLWWNEHIGKREFGHSVIFLGLAQAPDGSPGIRFWSSNQPDGYGEKVVPFTKVKRLLVSRITRPERFLATLPSLPKKDQFLAEMLTRDCSPRELAQRTGMPVPRDEASTSPATAPSGGESIPVVPVPATVTAVPKAQPVE